MISLGSTNLNIEYIFSDDIGVDLFLTNQKMDYILNNYLYYKYDEKDSYSVIKFYYGIYDKIEFVVSDTNLSNVEKLQLIHQMLMEKYNSSSIYIVTSIMYPNNIKFIQTYDAKSDTKCIFVDNNILIDKNYIKSIKSIVYSNIDVNVIDDYLITLKYKDVVTPTTVFFPKQNIDYPDLLLIEDNYLSEEEFNNLKETNDYKDVNIYSNYLQYKKLYNGFVFKINFNGYIKYLYLYSSVSNYKLKNELLDTLNYIDNNFSNSIFSFNQYSYAITSADTYPYLGYVYQNNIKEYIDYYPNPFVRQDLKFTFNSINDVDLPEYVLDSDINVEQLNLYKYEEDIKYKIKSYNNYLYDYVVNAYNNYSTTIQESNYSLFLDNYSNIKKYTNYITKQVEFQDIHSNYIDSNIGSLENSEYINIQGFDSTSNLPIILYVSKNIDYESFLLRQYKIAKGGLIPINNNELVYDYTSSVEEYLVDFIVSDYTNDQYDYNTLHNYIQNLDQNLNNRYLFTKNFNEDYSLYYNFKKITSSTLNYYIYKNSNYNCNIILTDDNILPQKVLYDIINLTTENDVYAALDNLFITNNTVFSNEDYVSDYMYFKYTQFIDSNYYYLFVGNFIYSYNELNKIIVYDLYNEIKKSNLVNIYSDSTLFTYNFDVIQNYITIDTTSYKEYPISNFIIDNLYSYEYYLDDNTNVSEKDDIMSLLIGEDVYSVNLTNMEDYYAVCIYDYKNILNSENKFVIFNKVIGIDWFAYYSLYSDIYDHTFSDLFINILNNFNKLILLYDYTSNELKNLSINNITLKTNDNNPIILNIDLIDSKLLYKINKSKYNNLLNNYKKFNYIYDISNLNIKYSYISYSDNNIFNCKYNDIIMVE